jgi:hypothetical protein
MQHCYNEIQLYIQTSLSHSGHTVSRRGELHPPALIGTVRDSLPSHGSRR